MPSLNVSTCTPALRISLNKNTAYHAGDTMIATAHLLACIDPFPVALSATLQRIVDIYIGIQLPNGLVLWLRPSNMLQTVLAAYISNFPLQDITATVFSYVIQSTDPLGNFAWIAGLATAGTLEVLGPIFQTSFTIA